MNEPRNKSTSLDDELKSVLTPDDKLSGALVGSLVDWIKRYQKSVLTSGLILLALGSTLFMRTQREEQSSLALGQYFQTWKASPLERPKLIDPINLILKQHPEWLLSNKSSYIQTGLCLDRLELVNQWRNWPESKDRSPTADPLLEISLKEALNQASLIAIALARGEWEPSLEKIEAWNNHYQKLELSQKKASLELCHLQLLAQKALIYRELKLAVQEYAAWQELLKAIDCSEDAVSSSLKPLYQEWLQAYGKGRLTLLDYIRWRLEELKA